MSFNKNDGDLVIWALMGLGAGVYWFFTGFRELKLKRAIQDISTSKIATGAVGSNVEITGRIVRDGDRKYKGPISGLPCLFYSIEIQKLVKTRNSSYWQKIDQYYSDPGFFVDDASGAFAQVLVDGAEIRRNGEVAEARADTRSLGTLPPDLLRDLTAHESLFKTFRLQSGGFWSPSREYRFLEWNFSEGETVYVLGFAESGIKAPSRIKLTFAHFLQAKKMVQEDPQLKARFDANKDGALSPEELEWGAKVIGGQLAARDAKQQPEAPLSKIKMIFKKVPPHYFIISNMHEQALVKQFGLMSTLKIFGGPALSLASLAYLLHFFH